MQDTPDLTTWTCQQCKRTILMPTEPTKHDAYLEAIMRIREHRLGHLIVNLDGASDADLLAMCKDEPVTLPVSPVPVGGIMDYPMQEVGADPVDADDLAPVLAGITTLLEADLPRARRVWYPIREDGGFNR